MPPAPEERPEPGWHRGRGGLAPRRRALSRWGAQRLVSCRRHSGDPPLRVPVLLTQRGDIGWGQPLACGRHPRDWARAQGAGSWSWERCLKFKNIL